MEKIPKDIIDKVIRGNDLVDIISGYVKLEKQGKNYFGLCPFHNENSPSFSVSPEKQIYHCFSCGEGGNVVNFISKIENISYPLSVKKLASQINLNIEQFFDDNRNSQELKYYEMNQFVADFYQFALLNTKEGKKALDYLKKRNIDLDIIKRFKIGLAPDSANSLYLALKSNNFSELMMVELGHVTRVNQNYYDKFKNRIMFPITDEYSSIVGFSGRTYLDTNKNEAKYVNTQETPIFKKRNIIYNLDQAKKTIKQIRKVFIFEGFMDVIASYKSDLQASVATMGTALTDYHVGLLKKYTDQFVLCYDGDAAGMEATKRTLDLLNRNNVKTMIVTLPEGLDPDDYLNKYGKEKYRNYIETKQKAYKEYMYDLYFKDINYDKIATLETFKRKVFSLLVHASLTERELFIQKLSNDINVSHETLNFDFNMYNKNQYQVNKSIPTKTDIIHQNHIFHKVEKYRPSKKKLYEAQKIILFMCLYNRRYCNIINMDSGITFHDTDFRILFFDLIDHYKLYDKFNKENFLEKFIKSNEEYLKFFMNFLKQYEKINMDAYDEENLYQSIAVIKTEIIAQFVSKLKNKLRTANDDEQLQIGQRILDQIKLMKSIKNNEVVK